jgi:hypothetical protein
VPPDLTVIVPAYEEGRHVRDVLAAIAGAVERLGRPFEILLVDDGSRDDTAEEAEAAARRDARIRVLRHERNRGKGAALATGVRAAAGEVLVFLDADLEISPDQVGPLVHRLEAAGAGVAVASKYHPESRVRRPLHRVVLSRVYQAVTALLFRLPIRDTQTGLKAMRRDVALRVVDAIRSRRYAWDIELLVLAHRVGARIVSAPVTVDFGRRGVRIGPAGFLASGLDTLRVFVRTVPAPSRTRPPRRAPRRTRFVVSADDLGLSPSVDRGVLAAVDAGHVHAVSLLVEGPTAPSAAAALRERGGRVDVGVHLDLARGRLAPFVARSLLGLVDARTVRADVRRQVAAARDLGLAATHVDAHRHAFFVPSVYRAVAAEAKALGLSWVRRPTPLGPVRCGVGLAGVAKGLLLALTSAGRRPILPGPDGVVDLATAASWAATSALPPAVRGRTVEVVAHPADGPDDLPRRERGIDRAAESRLLSSPPLAAALESLASRGAPSGRDGGVRRPAVAARPVSG